MPTTCAAVRLGYEQTEHAELREAAPHRIVGADAVARVLAAHVRGNRCAVGEETAQRVAQHLLVRREVEVHDARG